MTKMAETAYCTAVLSWRIPIVIVTAGNPCYDVGECVVMRLEVGNVLRSG